MRLNRFLARSGISSRRKADEIIKSGVVFVNDKNITNMGYQVKKEDTVYVNKAQINLPKFTYLALNKPTGVACTRYDKNNPKNVFQYLPEDKTLFTIGRLDKNTSGLILITNDGEFGQNIIHPRNKIEKEYLVTLKSPISDSEIKKLLEGVLLADGVAKAKKIKKINKKKIILIIEEGRNRIIRRMISALQNEVIRLKRIRIGDILLDTKIGQFRELKDKEISRYV